MQFDTIDLRLLRVFITVADCRGFSAAQAELNTSVSTISSQISDLETRLGLRLCQRGRTGFSLTSEGENIYKAARTLFHQISGFKSVVSDLKQELSGRLSLGFADNLITHPSAPMTKALQNFLEPKTDIEIVLTVLSPNQLERELLEQRLDVIIGAFPRHLPGINYSTLFEEHQNLYCGKGHPLFEAEEQEIAEVDITVHRQAQRGYTAGRPHPSNLGSGAFNATSYHMEGLVYLIMTGHFLGHLPDHYARRWVETGQLRCLHPDRFGYTSAFELGTRAGTHLSPVVRGFIQELQISSGQS
ncbi:LysR family transcriptional regulator [Kiloniella laminariae]|uniref:LysR family transcriptional regulator n=1 Tax=Kiloniella laminariae TaxID=454162 RepID=UPI000370CA70|nr:LysR family transcriptional regulator [Kiloniella laminariae]